MARPISMTASQLFANLFRPKPPVVLDIRIPDDLDVDPGCFPAAFRLPYQDFDDILAAVGSAASVVVVCHGGLKLSQGVASRLAARGVAAGNLSGGVEAWRQAGFPLLDAAAGPGIWATGWERTPARAMSRWLAARLLPHPTEVLVVAPDQIDGAVDRFAARMLPEPVGFLDLLDRDIDALAGVVGDATDPLLARLAHGHALRAGRPGTWQAAMSADLDALMQGALAERGA